MSDRAGRVAVWLTGWMIQKTGSFGSPIKALARRTSFPGPCSARACLYRYGAQGRPIKALPIEMGLELPVQIFTLKNRKLSPVAKLFIENAREVAKSMAKET